MNYAYWIASGGGIGRFPIAPGTVASLAALAIGAGALWLGHYVLSLLIVVSILAGIWAIHANRAEGDPGWIVIDEFAGQWVAMLGLTHLSVGGLITACVLFRILDIGKPGPIGWVDRRLGFIGVMADDVLAGLIAALILFAVTTLFPQARL